MEREGENIFFVSNLLYIPPQEDAMKPSVLASAPLAPPARQVASTDTPSYPRSRSLLHALHLTDAHEHLTAGLSRVRPMGMGEEEKKERWQGRVTADTPVPSPVP
jgi:hypothetical protein